MRIPTLLALLMLSTYALAAAGDNDFSGAWTASVCPSGAQKDPGRCSNFVLELLQKGDKLCGAHVFATAGAGRIDEGAAPSLTGNIADGAATATVTSGRVSPPIRVQVELRMVDGQLQWKRLENPKGDYLLPLSAQMNRSRRKTLMTPMFEQELSAACSSVFTMAVEGAAPPMKPPGQ
jgi:hypothetical protein